VGIGCVLGLTSPLHAASRDSKERVARTACLAGDYTKGVTILSELFVSTKEPVYIHNQGRCFEQNARCPEAISRFQEYLRVAKKLTEKEKGEVQKHIDDCQEMMAKQYVQAAITAAPAKEEPKETPAPVQTIAVSPPVQPTNQPSNPQPVSESGSGLRTAGIVTAAIGGAAVVTGVILNLKVNSMASDFKTRNGYTDSKESDRKTYKTMGLVGYGVGAACVATGAVLYYLGLRAGKPGSLALAPMLSPGAGIVAVEGAF
jgi:hypothetical protein